MRTLYRRLWWFAVAAPLLAVTGCFTGQQLQDFGRTELARQAADAFGRWFQLAVQATT